MLNTWPNIILQKTLKFTLMSDGLIHRLQECEVTRAHVALIIFMGCDLISKRFK